MIQADE
jgi:hypothetical protein